MKFLAYILAAVLVCVAAQSSHACPVALQSAAVVQDHCAVQLNVAPVVAAPVVQHYVAPQAVVVQPQVQAYVAPQAVVLQQNVHVQRQRVQPVKTFIANVQANRAGRQAQRAAQKAVKSVVVQPQALIVAPY